MALLTSFFDAFNIEPNDERLYQYALTHRSYVHQHRKNKREDQQERLEFFGDAVLKFIVSYYLMHRFPNMEEGMLTKIRARIISDQSLAKVSLAMGLDQYVQISDSEKAVSGQLRPALLSDTFEAILAAIFLDLGIEYVQDWFNHVVETHMAEYLDEDFIVDYKTFLQERIQKYGDALPLYNCLKMTGPEHKKVFHYEVTVSINGMPLSYMGTGSNKKMAQQSAAKRCVKALQEKQLIDN
ncbi:MAG: ribonuclease III [Candidatus Marinamargulisbacteria bacterium]